MCNSAAHNSRPGRESLSKRLGVATTRAIHTRDGGRCVYCARTAIESGAHLQLDHLTPKSLGGADEAANLVLACRRCNSARKALSLGAWSIKAMRELGLAFSPSRIVAHAAKV